MKKVDRKIVKSWSRQQNRDNRKEIYSLALLGFLNILLALGQAYSLARLLAGFLLQKTEMLLTPLYLFILISFLRILLGYFQEITSLSLGISARKKCRHALLQKIHEIGPSLLRHYHSAALAEILVDKLESLEGYFARFIPASHLWLFSQWVIVLVVFWQAPKAGLILGAACLSLPLFQAIFGISTAIASRKQFLAMSRLQIRFLDRIKGIATIILSGNSQKDQEHLDQASDELRHRTMKVLRIAFIASTTTDIAMVIALIAIIISQAGTLLHAESLSLATKSFFAVLMVPEAFVPFRMLSAAYQDRAHGSAMAEAEEQLSHYALPHISLKTPSLEKISEKYDEKTAIQLKNISFSWSQERGEVLSELNLTLKKGEIAILEGASGAGKSTLMELILGFIPPSKGEIFFFNQDAASLSLKERNRFMSWIGQKPVLFSASLKENILFANPDASEEEFHNALQAAQIFDFLPSLPQGLETKIGESGYGLSGGQAQRLALARAFLKNAPLILLDEPTAHLDPKTEGEILSSLKDLFKNRTVLIATHSTQYAEFCQISQKITLEKGRLLQ